MVPSLPNAAPETQGISASAILRFIEDAGQAIHELHSFVLVRHGQVVARGGWAPYAADRPHMLFSLTKSFTSTAVGLAVAEGRLSVDDPVVSFFPDDLPAEVSPNLAAMKVRHLLTMSTGHEQDSTDRMFQQPEGNFPRGFLALPVEHEPGAPFVYNSGASHMLSAIVQKVTGQPLKKYLAPRLFQPLGIRSPAWERDPRGINIGGWGLSLTAEQVARFGQLYLQKGVWNGQRLLPETWVEQATRKQVSNGAGEASDWAQGYGYQFWRCRHHAYRGDGAFGQFCLVLPDQDAVLAIHSGVADMQAVLDLVWADLLPAFCPTPLAEDRGANEALQQKLSGLAYPAPRGATSSPLAAQFSGRRFVFETNPQRARWAEFVFDGSRANFTIQNGLGTHSLNAGLGEWVFDTTTLHAQRKERMKAASSGVWVSTDTFVITLRYYETPFYFTLTCRFEGDRLSFTSTPNVAFGPIESPALSAKLAA